MKKVMMRFEPGGEAFEIWNTEAKTLEDAFREMDYECTCVNELDGKTGELIAVKKGGEIFFEGGDTFLSVNGGFR